MRELGLDLATVRQVLSGQASLSEVAATHADALSAQIRILRLRHAVLTVAAQSEPSPDELRDLHSLATLSEVERRHLVDDFLGSVFDWNARAVRERTTADGRMSPLASRIDSV